jgi:ribosomal protein S19
MIPVIITENNKKITIVAVCVGIILCVLFFGIQYKQVNKQPDKVYHNLSETIEATETRQYTYDEAVKSFEGNQQALDFIERERKRQ